MPWLDCRFEELARQLAFTPVRKRREQLNNASRLFASIDPSDDYTWEYLWWRITTHRPREGGEHRISGKAVLADLAAFVETVSGTLNLTVAESAEILLPLDQVMRRLKASEKTIQRWRRQGLLAGYYVYPDGVRRLGFRLSDIERFERRRQARCKPGAGGALAIAARTDRGADGEPRELGLGKNHADGSATPDGVAAERPLTGLDQEIVAACVQRGVPADFLARRYGQDPASIGKAVRRQQALRLKSQPIHFVTNPLFDLPDARRIIMEVLPAEAAQAARETSSSGAADWWSRLPSSVPAAVADAFRLPPMPHPLVTDTFRRMNYLKAQASRLQAQLDVETASLEEMAQIEELLAQAAALRNQLLQAHLRIVVHVARRHVRAGDDLLELISDGNLWLLRAVGSFDFSRGVKFSTYLTYALMRNFAHRFSARQSHADERLLLAQDSLLEELDTPAETAESVPESVDRILLQRQLADALPLLPPRQREVLAAHYGLQAGQGPWSLARIADNMGITKTRVRQIEASALQGLRRILRAAPRAAPAPVTPSPSEKTAATL